MMLAIEIVAIRACETLQFARYWLIIGIAGKSRFLWLVSFYVFLDFFRGKKFAFGCDFAVVWWFDFYYEVSEFIVVVIFGIIEFLVHFFVFNVHLHF